MNKDELKKNNLKKFLIIILLLVAIFLLYYFITGDNPLRIKIVDIPYSVKCYFKEEQCETGYIDGWSLLSAFIYLLAGYLFPDKHFWALAIAIIIQFVQPFFGIHSKYIIDPLLDITFYSIGSLVSDTKN